MTRTYPEHILECLKIPLLLAVTLIFVMTLVPMPANAMKSGRAPLETRTLTAVDFGAGSLIIPMDTTYQNTGMWKAYGLLYRLLSNNIPVHWAIANPMTFNGIDFSATTSDLRTNTANGTPSYRGGPFIIDSAHAAQATSIIQTWWGANANLPVVHKATAAFTANTDTTLKSAPRIAEDVENAKIAYGYFNAAGIPDMNGNIWTDKSPNILTETQIANGALFQSGLCSERNYDIFVTPHNGGYTYSKTDPNNLGTRYYAALDYFNYQGGGWTALCHSILSNENNLVDLYNNSSPAVRALFYSPVNGGLLTRNGFPAIQNKGDKGSWTVIPSSASLPIAQAVATTALQDLPGGAVQTWLTTQEQYYSNTERVAYFTNSGNQYDHVIAGTYHDGTGGGKIIFIGGHEFSTNTPYLTNADAPYLRMFYNSLFFNGTAVANLDITTSPHQVPLGENTAFKINVINTGGSTATSAQNVSMILESGVTYQSMDPGYPFRM